MVAVADHGHSSLCLVVHSVVAVANHGLDNAVLSSSDTHLEQDCMLAAINKDTFVGK